MTVRRFLSSALFNSGQNRRETPSETIQRQSGLERGKKMRSKYGREERGKGGAFPEQELPDGVKMGKVPCGIRLNFEQLLVIALSREAVQYLSFQHLRQSSISQLRDSAAVEVDGSVVDGPW